MTADVELLRRYAKERSHVSPRMGQVMEEAAREIEALRAEVERLEDESQSRLEACGDAVSKLCAAEARAERLAEALRPHIEDLERCAVIMGQYPAMAPTAAEVWRAAAELRAALHPTATQENDDA